MEQNMHRPYQSKKFTFRAPVSFINESRHIDRKFFRQNLQSIN